MSNSLAKVHPELISEWSDKNYPLIPDNITFGSNKMLDHYNLGLKTKKPLINLKKVDIMGVKKD